MDRETRDKLNQIKRADFRVNRLEYKSNFVVFYAQKYAKGEWHDMGGNRRYDINGKFLEWFPIHAGYYPTPFSTEKEALEFIEIYKGQRIEYILKEVGIVNTEAYFRKNKFDKIK